MAAGNSNSKPRLCILALIAIVFLLTNEHVEGRKNTMMINVELVKHKGTVKTIKSEDGDLIDCVDIYKQPAFDHPLLKNHTIQMKPSSYPISGLIRPETQANITQSWLKRGLCNEGTVPIRRTTKHHDHKAIPLARNGAQLNHSIEGVLAQRLVHEYAVALAPLNNYHGAQASINCWNAAIENHGEFSIAQIWVASGTVSKGNLNTIEAGWHVYPQLYNDNQARLFVFWTRDHYKSTGCYNLRCPGFVQISQNFAVGSPLTPVSRYNGNQFEIGITVFKDKQSGNWWLWLGNEAIGYWPGSMFTELANSAARILWGGEIVNTEPGNRHTATQMGSGHFPKEGYGRSSYFRNLAVVDEFDTLRDPGNLRTIVSNPSCYDIHVQTDYFYFGGPGYSEGCPR